MQIDCSDASIVIVGDELALVNEAGKLIGERFSRVGRAVGSEQMVRTVEEREPAALVLAFSSLIEAERSYLALFRNCNAIHAIRHVALLACAGSERETAFDLVSRGVFDDYIIVRPLYDRHRLTLSLLHALQRQALAADSSEALRPLAGLGPQAAQVSRAMNRHAEDVRSLHGEIGQMRERVDQVIGDKLSELTDRMLLQAGAAKMQPGTMQKLASREVSPVINRTLEQAERRLAEFCSTYEVDSRAGKALAGRVDSLASLARSTVLVVDDDPLYCEVLRTLLSNGGYDVAVAEVGAKALAACGRLRPAIVLVDYELPGLSGLDLVRIMRRVPSLENTPLIMLTGHGERAVVSGAKKAGVDDFILKPSTAEHILGKIQSVLNRASHEREAPAGEGARPPQAGN